MRKSVSLDMNTLQLMIECAINTKKQIRIQYRDMKGVETLRFVEPIKWLKPSKDNTKDTAGFLTYCHVRDEFRHFKVYSIERILITDYDYEWVNEQRAV